MCCRHEIVYLGHSYIQQNLKEKMIINVLYDTQRFCFIRAEWDLSQLLDGNLLETEIFDNILMTWLIRLKRKK